MHHAGKGDEERSRMNRKKFNEGFDRIFKKREVGKSATKTITVYPKVKP